MTTFLRPFGSLQGVAALLGLLPFMAGLLFFVFPGLAPVSIGIVERALLGYAAAILAFVGGVRWGVPLGGGPGGPLTYVLGLLGSILAFFALLLPLQGALVAFIGGFALQGLWDVVSGQNDRLPESYANLRGPMTLLVCVLLALTLVVVSLNPPPIA